MRCADRPQSLELQTVDPAPCTEGSARPRRGPRSAGIAAAQTNRTVQATGSATLSVTSDQAFLDVGVVTTAGSAQDSAQQNATQTTAVSPAVKAVLGATGTVQTLYYSIYPRYVQNIHHQRLHHRQHHSRDHYRPFHHRPIDRRRQRGRRKHGRQPQLRTAGPRPASATGADGRHQTAMADALHRLRLGGKVVSVDIRAGRLLVFPILVGGDRGGATATTTPVQTGTSTVYPPSRSWCSCSRQ